MITREEFESWPSKKKRSYAERMYLKVAREWAEELHEAGIYQCVECAQKRFNQFHHIWSRAQIPSLWWLFQRDNLLPVCNNCHPRKFHDTVCELNSQDYIDRQLEIMKSQEAEYQKQYRA